MARNINGDSCHDYFIEKAPLKLSFKNNKERDFYEWQSDVRAKLWELLCMDRIEKCACPGELQVECIEELDGYRRIRFTFMSEKDMAIPCYLLLPDTKEGEKVPLVITLQGHKKGGMYISVGISKNEVDAKYQPIAAYALQAVRRGYAALCVELRGMGELIPSTSNRYRNLMCDYTAQTALLLGRTVLGERVWDIMRAIDLLPAFPEIDTEKIAILGHSGGGTTAFYAACLDERIKVCMPSCSFCSFKRSILDARHCVCNFIPGLYDWLEMADLTSLIAPRRLAIVAGESDPAFMVDGVRDAFDTVEAIYDRLSAKENTELVVTPMGHYWCEDLAYDALERAVKALGWR